jgi:hypothetical protein
VKVLFEQYKKQKQKLAVNYKGYELDKILAVDLIALIYKKEKFNFKSLLRFVLRLKVEIPDQTGTVLYSIGRYGRKDYYELLDYVRIQAVGSLLDLSKIKPSMSINILNMVKAVRIVNNTDLDFLNKLTLAAKVTYTLNTIDYLEKRNQSEHNINSFCSFCSNLNEEAILDFYFKKRNIPTYTLQHGLWFIYEKYPVDAIAYENLIADKLLSWGQYTIDEFIAFGVNKKQLLLAGYPKYAHALSRPKKKQGNLKVLVLFARKIHHKNNLALIDLLANTKVNLEVEFKLHPSLDRHKYSQLAEFNGFSMAPQGTINELLKTGGYDFSISYNSTAYYDSYMNNCISLRYKDVDADNALEVLDDGFSSGEELLHKLDLVQQGIASQVVWDKVTERLHYILGYGVNNYASIQNKN